MDCCFSCGVRIFGLWIYVLDLAVRIFWTLDSCLALAVRIFGIGMAVLALEVRIFCL